MKAPIIYAKNIIVGVIRHQTWHWYVTDKELWFLDLTKLEQAFLDKGYEVYGAGDYAERYDIAIINHETADLFLQAISDYEVSTEELREAVQQAVYEPDEEGVFGYSPALLIDFDNRTMLSYYPEPASFEHYVPDGWTGKYEDFTLRVPPEQQYWIVDGKDLFVE
ncbi:hypothetical protein Q5741_20790 [Paenibacillus sp. JX-17]|uniref:Group-specific protein n=1 Tax=Paenibacillus lacisoli TaxID=3064525 RepID=A0ABT9CHR7_9BACL|nr:hypothetical protein [Paenibacillus sp. JX-17]MDO7908826.1 hypothetical protein [Paenibacillus sp. JX-17]